MRNKQSINGQTKSLGFAFTHTKNRKYSEQSFDLGQTPIVLNSLAHSQKHYSVLNCSIARVNY